MFILTYFVVVTLSLNLPFNYGFSSRSQENLFYISSILPQGWAFFTRDPQEPSIHIYSYDDLGHIEEFSFRGSSSQNYYGLRKNFRIIQMEIGEIVGKIDSPFVDIESLETLKRDLDFCPEYVDNEMESKIICGDVLLVYKSIVPYAYRGFNDSRSVSYKCLNIKCD